MNRKTKQIDKLDSREKERERERRKEEIEKKLFTNTYILCFFECRRHWQ